MLVVFWPIFVLDTEMIFRYDLVAPLNLESPCQQNTCLFQKLEQFFLLSLRNSRDFMKTMRMVNKFRDKWDAYCTGFELDFCNTLTLFAIGGANL